MKNPVMKQFGTRLVLLAVGSGLLAGSAVAYSQKSKAENPPVDVRVDERPIARQTTQQSLSPVVKKVSPGVVKVFTSVKTTPASYGELPGQMDEWMRRFFGDQFRGRGPAPDQRMPRQHGVGSGVIVTQDGYILTNNHVVEGAEDVKVAMADGTEYTAKVIGGDPKTDIAILKIEAENLPVVPMADSDNVEVGDFVLAVGNPFGIGQTVTTGIVSATGRAGTTGLDYEDFIQTDAAINPGNSGGALVDIEGRLIGINTAILSRSGGNQGIGFAIPTNLARGIMESIVENGKVTRGYLGVMIQDITPSLAKEFNLEERKGALVGDVTPRGPADRSGLKSGDVILEFNGKKVADSRRLRLEVAGTRPGERVSIKVLRDGKPKTIEATVRELPGQQQLARHESGEVPHVESGTLSGVGVTDLDAQARRQFRVPANLKGAVITEVRPESAAAQAGLRPGDIIQEINRKPVQNADEAVQMTENAENKRTLLRVWRDGGSRYVVVDETDAG